MANGLWVMRTMHLAREVAPGASLVALYRRPSGFKPAVEPHSKTMVGRTACGLTLRAALSLRNFGTRAATRSAAAAASKNRHAPAVSTRGVHAGHGNLIERVPVLLL
jgi:hypothetical protein